MKIEMPDKIQKETKKNYLDGVSEERRRELINAKNSLKEIVENIPYDKLKTMDKGIDPMNFFINGCNGDVNVYALKSMEAESGNPPNVAAWHVVENLNRIINELS